jgi:hypothetical protein
MPAYQPQTTDGRAEWWQNIQANASPYLTSLGFAAGDITAIMNDAKWAIFLYRDVRVTYEHFHEALVDYADTITGGTNGDTPPPAPEPADWPTAPTPAVDCGIERRRELWVQRVKNSAGYSQSIGEALGIVAPSVPFDPATYVPVLTGLRSPSARTVTGKFRKAYGNVDGIILFARKEGGSAAWTELGRFNAVPFTALVPITATNPEVWEFAAQAFKRDVPFGNMSEIHQVTIKP